MAETTLTPDAVNEMVATAFPGSRARCVEVGTSHAVAEMVTGDLDVRPGGFVAGPTQFALADAALWYLVFGALGRIEPMALTAELSIRYLRPAIGSSLHARADLAAISRRSVVGSVALWTGDISKPTAVAQGTYALPLAT
jgi:acyl-coenzyme A thioesterase PaaI-like protein